MIERMEPTIGVEPMTCRLRIECQLHGPSFTSLQHSRFVPPDADRRQKKRAVIGLCCSLGNTKTGTIPGSWFPLTPERIALILKLFKVTSLLWQTFWGTSWVYVIAAFRIKSYSFSHPIECGGGRDRPERANDQCADSPSV